MLYGITSSLNEIGFKVSPILLNAIHSPGTVRHLLLYPALSPHFVESSHFFAFLQKFVEFTMDPL